MINLLSESAYIAQTNKIKTAITNKVNEIKNTLARIGTKLGATINWLDDVESTLDDELTAINTELVDKGSTQADDFSEVAEKISDIQSAPPKGWSGEFTWFCQLGYFIYNSTTLAFSRKSSTAIASIFIKIPKGATKLKIISDGFINNEAYCSLCTNIGAYPTSVAPYKRTHITDDGYISVDDNYNYVIIGVNSKNMGDSDTYEFE